ncbi:MAG: baseplate J/gp47 family protein [Lachnospiraceae bacterium]|nr:baseplate J/gp47 family protein [Lachnospiraceae bacterium]
MAGEEWGLTHKGFYRPEYVQILNAVEYRARELFGDNVNLTVRSPLGILLRIDAWMMNILFGVLEKVYNSRFVDTSEGSSLYNLGRMIGMYLLPAGKATGYVTIEGAEGTVVPAGYLLSTPGGLQYTVMREEIIGAEGKTLALVQAVQTGKEYNTDAGTIIHIVNPAAVRGIKGVYNESPVINGRERETDAEYRNRYYKSVDYAGGVNTEAVRAALLQDVQGVYAAYVYENDSDVYDPVYKLPPHSIEAVVYGGLDEDIARTIYEKKAGGIQTNGNKSVPVMTNSEQLIDISFSRPDLIDVHIRIFNLETNEDFPGEDTIKEALINFIGGDASGGLGIGADVSYQGIPAVVMQIKGILDFDFVMGKSVENLNREKVEIGIREKAVTAADKVVIG